MCYWIVSLLLLSIGKIYSFREHLKYLSNTPSLQLLMQRQRRRPPDMFMSTTITCLGAESISRIYLRSLVMHPFKDRLRLNSKKPVSESRPELDGIWSTSRSFAPIALIYSVYSLFTCMLIADDAAQGDYISGVGIPRVM